MSHHVRIGFRIALLGTGLACSTLTGCDGGDEAPAVGIAPIGGPIDGPSPDTLLERYNALAFGASVVDHEALLALYHAENDAQDRILRILRDSVVILELDQAMWERFGRGINPAAILPPLTPIREPARITARINQRVSATYTRNDGREARLYLVRIGDRWRISGHSLEIDDAIDSGQLDRMERMNAYLTPFAASITARIRAGEFRTRAEAAVALGQTVAAVHPEVRDRPDLMFGAER